MRIIYKLKIVFCFIVQDGTGWVNSRLRDKTSPGGSFLARDTGNTHYGPGLNMHIYKRAHLAPELPPLQTSKLCKQAECHSQSQKAGCISGLSLQKCDC